MRPKFNNRYKGIRCRIYLDKESIDDDESIYIKDSSDAYELVKDELANSDRQIILSILLTAENYLIGVETVNIGSIKQAIMTPSDIFKSAILSNASSFIICHTEPYGDLDPTYRNVRMAKHLIEAGDLLGIKLQDFLVISCQGYRSVIDDKKLL